MDGKGHRIFGYPTNEQVDGAEYCPHCDDCFPFQLDRTQKEWYLDAYKKFESRRIPAMFK